MKLIRDDTPGLLPNSTRPASNNEEFKILLRMKLIEEAAEAASSTSEEELREELADLWEVFNEILLTEHINLEGIIQLARRKKERKGGFKQGRVLFYDPPENKHK